MRIAFLSVSGGMGGSEASLVELVRGMRRLSPASMAVVVVPVEGPLAVRVRELGADVRVLPMPAALAKFGEWSLRGTSSNIARRGAALVGAAGAIATYQRALATLLSDLSPDVIHTNGFKLHIFGTRAAPAGVPVVWHLHEYVSRRPLTRRLLRYHVSRASAIVANSRSVAADVSSALGAGAPVTSIYNAVNLDEFSPTGPTADLDAHAHLPPAAPGTIRIGLVATFARWKGHETFLRAIAGMGSEPVRAYIVGGPMYDTAGSEYTLEELRAMTAAMGLADRVGFTGFVERPADVMRALDVVVHASTEPEPFGLVIAEGLACGRAVVVSAAGGAAELVEDDVDALTVPPGDAAALARALTHCADNAALRARLGNAARRTALRRFDPDIFARQFLEVYERVSHRPTVMS
jgi:glycosyltransferase involved in cell wall biosynthesis